VPLAAARRRGTGPLEPASPSDPSGASTPDRGQPNRQPGPHRLHDESVTRGT